MLSCGGEFVFSCGAAVVLCAAVRLVCERGCWGCGARAPSARARVFVYVFLV